MIKYLTTRVQPNIVETILKYHLNQNKNFVLLPQKISKYIEDKFNLDIKMILDSTIENIKVSQVEEDLVSIYILNERLGDSDLESILQLIEFGNREIPGTQQITKLIDKSLSQVEDDLGGA